MFLVGRGEEREKGEWEKDFVDFCVCAVRYNVGWDQLDFVFFWFGLDWIVCSLLDWIFGSRWKYRWIESDR